MHWRRGGAALALACVTTLLLAVGLVLDDTAHYYQHVSDDTAAHVAALQQHYHAPALRERFGSDRALDRRATRSLYNTILRHIEEDMRRVNTTYAARDRAAACARMRYEARHYARTRDGTFRLPVVNAALRVRDAYVHGVRHLPRALWRDVAQMARQRRVTTLRTTRLTLRSACDCLLPFRHGACPSYAFLREVRGKSDDDILASCTLSNAYYNE